MKKEDESLIDSVCNFIEKHQKEITEVLDKTAQAIEAGEKLFNILADKSTDAELEKHKEKSNEANKSYHSDGRERIEFYDIEVDFSKVKETIFYPELLYIHNNFKYDRTFGHCTVVFRDGKYLASGQIDPRLEKLLDIGSHYFSAEMLKCSEGMSLKSLSVIAKSPVLPERVPKAHPGWICEHCQWLNYPIRKNCRNCSKQNAKI